MHQIFHGPSQEGMRSANSSSDIISAHFPWNLFLCFARLFLVTKDFMHCSQCIVAVWGLHWWSMGPRYFSSMLAAWESKRATCVWVCVVLVSVCVCVCLWCGVCGVLCSGHAGLAGFCGFGLMQYLYCCFLLVFCLMKNTSFQILHHQKSIQTLTKRPRNTPVQILHQPNNPSKPSKTVVQILHQPNNPNKPSKTVVQILHHKKTKGN